MSHEIIQGHIVHGRIDGFAINYAHRASYGLKMFTYVQYFNGKKWISLGDPWRGESVPPNEIRAEIERKEGYALDPVKTPAL